MKATTSGFGRADRSGTPTKAGVTPWPARVVHGVVQVVVMTVAWVAAMTVLLPLGLFFVVLAAAVLFVLGLAAIPIAIAARILR